jgi:hypothetical protein
MVTKADNDVLNLVSPPISDIVAVAGTFNATSIGLTTPGPAIFSSSTVSISFGVVNIPQYSVVLSGNPSSYAIPSTPGQALVSNGPGINPSFGLVSLSQVYGILSAANGGTGLSYLTPYSVMAGNGVGPVALISPTPVNLPLISNGPSAFPYFGYLDLVNAVSGILPVTNGGTGTSYLTPYSVLCGSGATVPAFVGPVIAEYPLICNGTTAYPSFEPLNLGGPGVTGVLPAANVGVVSSGNPIFAVAAFTSNASWTILWSTVKATVIGGGGGGGGWSSSDGGGGGGGSGAAVINIFTGLPIGGTLNIIVGGAGGPGGVGGTSSVTFGSTSCVAGGGSPGATGNMSTGALGGNGGIASGAGLLIDGSPGSTALLTFATITGGGMNGAIGILGSYGAGGRGSVYGGTADPGFPGIVLLESIQV